MMRSSYTSTAPTIGLGATWPAPRPASWRQRRIYVSEAVKGANLIELGRLWRLILRVILPNGLDDGTKRVGYEPESLIWGQGGGCDRGLGNGIAQREEK